MAAASACAEHGCAGRGYEGRGYVESAREGRGCEVYDCDGTNRCSNVVSKDKKHAPNPGQFDSHASRVRIVRVRLPISPHGRVR